MRPAVLIVDDDLPLLGLLQTLIRRDGDCDIVACRDGDEAIRELASRHFDVVLLDLMMPRRNGLDVIEYLRENWPRQLSVVLVLTAASNDLTRRIDPSVVHAIVENRSQRARFGRWSEHHPSDGRTHVTSSPRGRRPRSGW